MNRPSNNSINKIGKKITSNQLNCIDKNDLQILNEFRALKLHPLNEYFNFLNETFSSYKDLIIVTRLKRMSTIFDKVLRYAARGITLSKMADIAGARIIAKDMTELREIFKLASVSTNRFKIVEKRTKDYISNPKESGYRGMHLIIKYENEEEPLYNGTLIELQIRTQYQHIVTTATELVSIEIESDLKTRYNPDGWGRFFYLVMTYFAIKESCPHTYNGSIRELVRETRELYHSLNVDKVLCNVEEANKSLRLIQCTTNIVAWFIQTPVWLLTSDYNCKKLSAIGGREPFEGPFTDYHFLESQVTNPLRDQVLLVQTNDPTNLKNAYRNYYLDVKDFRCELERLLDPKEVDMNNTIERSSKALIGKIRHICSTLKIFMDIYDRDIKEDTTDKLIGLQKHLDELGADNSFDEIRNINDQILSNTEFLYGAINESIWSASDKIEKAKKELERLLKDED